MAYDWPGNVRELENTIERALIRYGSGPLSFETLPPPAASDGIARDQSWDELLLSLDGITTRHIRRALEKPTARSMAPTERPSF
jgi:DNA-binding NtrC family response regulator